MASIEIPSGVKILSATTVDDLGKFDAIDEPTAVSLALSSIPLALRYVGRKVLCNGVEYVFNTVADSGFISAKSPTITAFPETDGASIIVGKERYNMEVSSYSITGGILSINFKKENRGFNNVIIKSVSLGILNPTQYARTYDTFPQYQATDNSVLKLNLALPNPLLTVDIPIPPVVPADTVGVVTSNLDFEFIVIGLYANESLVSYSRVGTTVTVVFNKDPILQTLVGQIECIDLGFSPINATSYTLTRVSALSYTVTSPISGNIASTPIANGNFVLYIPSDTESSSYGMYDSTALMSRAKFSNGFVRAMSITGDMNWKNGTFSTSVFFNRLGFVADRTAEVFQNVSTVYSNYDANNRLPTNRPRLSATTNYYQFYAQGTNGGVCQFDSGFFSNQTVLPVCPSVSTHTNVVGNGTIATITCTVAHALTTGDTVIINSNPLSLVNASVVVTVTTATAFTFPYTTVVTSQTDSTGYNYLTHAQRTTTTVVNTTGTLATITTSINHGYAVGNTVFVHSSLLSLVGVPVNITAVTANTFTFANTTNIATATADTGYSNKSTRTFLKTVKRVDQILDGVLRQLVTLTFTSAPNQFDTTATNVLNFGFQLGSYLRITNSTLAFTNAPFIVQNLLNEYGAVTSTGAMAFPNQIQFFNSGTLIPTETLNGGAIVNFSQRYHTRASFKAKDHRAEGWFIAGTEPANTSADKYMYDRLRVGYYANMGSLGWNHYTLPNAANKSFFGRHTYFGNFTSGITEVTATDINIISDGAYIVGNTTAPATTRKGIVKFDSTTNQLSFSDGVKYFKVNEERIKFFLEGNIGALALSKLESVGEINTLMSSAVYINKATEISEIYFIIGSVASGQTSGQITVTLQHVALGQTLEIDAATIGTTVATATYNFVNGVAISRYVKNTLSSITGSIPADRMLFAKIQTTSPFNGGANAVQDIVVTVKLR